LLQAANTDAIQGLTRAVFGQVIRAGMFLDGLIYALRFCLIFARDASEIGFCLAVCVKQVFQVLGAGYVIDAGRTACSEGQSRFMDGDVVPVNSYAQVCRSISGPVLLQARRCFRRLMVFPRHCGGAKTIDERLCGYTATRRHNEQHGKRRSAL
jgi:hypothetical protein